MFLRNVLGQIESFKYLSLSRLKNERSNPDSDTDLDEA
jgi:hypothetical protein